MSAASWLFKKIALDPLRSDIQLLSETINRQLKIHEQSLADLGQHLRTHDDELGSHSVRKTTQESKEIHMKFNWKLRLLSYKFWLALVPAILLLAQAVAAPFDGITKKDAESIARSMASKWFENTDIPVTNS